MDVIWKCASDDEAKKQEARGKQPWPVGAAKYATANTVTANVLIRNEWLDVEKTETRRHIMELSHTIPVHATYSSQH